ncbi:MAG: hypothetical protein H0X57_15245, partial [Rubrobacter sp.]|nr:hypothetical protein [Rubrobacter sp.]
MNTRTRSGRANPARTGSARYFAASVLLILLMVSLAAVARAGVATATE